MTEKRYLIEPDLFGRAFVTGAGNDDRPWLRLDRTWFHPQGGGQKSDRGTIAGLGVEHVAHDGDDVIHFLEVPYPVDFGGEVTISIDRDHRFENSRWHTGGHLIAALVERDWPGVRAVSGHHWPGEGRVEFIAERAVDPGAIVEQLTGAIERAIRDDQAVKVVVGSDGIRTVGIGDYPPIPCGGTHVSSTMELGRMIAIRAKIKDGKLRVSYELSPGAAAPSQSQG